AARRHHRRVAGRRGRPGLTGPTAGPPAPGGRSMSNSKITSRTPGREARILGIGGYRPARSVPNAEIVKNIDSSDEWIRTRSGIVSRRWANAEETVVAMSLEAAGKAMAHAGVTADQIGCVVV